MTDTNSSVERAAALLSLEAVFAHAPRAIAVFTLCGSLVYTNRLGRRAFLVTGEAGQHRSRLSEDPTFVADLRRISSASIACALQIRTPSGRLEAIGWRMHDVPGLPAGLIILKQDTEQSMSARLLAASESRAQASRELAVIEAERQHLQAQARRLSYLAATDRLTGLLNSEEFARRCRTYLHAPRKRAGTFVFLDCDDFKSINDTYGHRTGDIILATLGARLRSFGRTDDLVGRLGGDEFGIWFAGSGAREAARLMDRLRSIVEAPIPRPETSGLVGPREISITFSMGAASAPVDGARYSDLLETADARMYEMKTTRRLRA